MSIHITSFGCLKSGAEAKLYTLTNKNGMQAQFTDYGAVWVSAIVPTEDGLVDTMLGFDSVKGYEEDDCHMGCPVGRVANRTTGPMVVIDGKNYPLTVTNVAGGQAINLHSGYDYYEKRMWEAVPLEAQNSIRFHLLSPHMDQGFPGNLHITITYTLTEDNAVKISYDAVSDENTVFNMTNHAYFNLNGGGTVWKHKLWVDSSHYTETVKGIPTGRLLPVEGSPYDYRVEKAVDIRLDDNFCEASHHTIENARVKCTGEKTGIVMEVHTDLPGVQIYTAAFTKEGSNTEKPLRVLEDGICFETQFYVNAMNTDNPQFKKPILRKNEKFHSESWYKFR